MEPGEFSASGSCRPCLGAEGPSRDGIVESSERPGIDRCEPIQKVEDASLIGILAEAAEAAAAVDAAVCGGEGSGLVPVDLEVKTFESGSGKRKRGRPPRGQPKPPPTKKKKEEEDVCFICFDGGSLVLCDRRGCPKAYHPACIKRDEAFFRSRARWNCGWHICSTCQKAAHYMCYTCTYSLCKACTKGADYMCVRENKGFCSMCMRTIMLIENKDQREKEMAQVDFDDKSSWEYLFKMYWLYLKEKLSLTLDELTKARTPWKADGAIAYKGKPLDAISGNNDLRSLLSDIPPGCKDLEVNNSGRKWSNEQTKLLNFNDNDSPTINKSGSDEGATFAGSAKWASKELLAFVAHVKNGDTSELSQFDAQALLLDYVNRNSLRDPHQQSQIVCDTRLVKLFGKPRVGLFEMLKLLEFHFPLRDESQKYASQCNIYPAVVSQAEGNGDNDNFLMMGKDKKRRTRKKDEERGPPANLSEFAAIDVHNINLIYLRRSLMENLIDDNGKLHDKVVGSMVGIRISGSDEKQDMYRLVQVVGTCKVAVPYKIGKKTVDAMLEILNLDKKETISIDALSNQEFSEDECRHLRESIKYGLVQRLTVGQIQEKAKALREVIVNDWLETEVLRLNNLRDRANEMGNEKELRECVEKLELLKTPEERHRRLQEVPEVHVDPNMNPNNKSEEEAGELDAKYVKTQYSGFSRNGREAISRNADRSIDTCSKTLEVFFNNSENENKSTVFYLDKVAPTTVSQGVNTCTWSGGKDACGLFSSEGPGTRVDSSCSAVGGWNNPAAVSSGSFSAVASETSVASRSTGNAPLLYDSETNNFWRYRDPNGKVQGPFCLLQLRKWSTTGYFPTDLRVWSIYDKEVDSFLLTDVLKGQPHKSLSLQYNISLSSQDIQGASENRSSCQSNGSNSSLTSAGLDGKQSGISQNLGTAVAYCNSGNKLVQGDGGGSQSSNCATPAFNYIDINKSSSHCWDTVEVNNLCSEQAKVLRSDSTSTLTLQPNETSLPQERGHEDEKYKSGPDERSWNSQGNTTHQTSQEKSCENQSNNQVFLSHSSGHTWGPQTVGVSSNKWDLNSSFSSATKSTLVSSERNCEIDIPNLPNPTPNAHNGDLKDQAAKGVQSESLNVHIQDSGVQNLPSSTPKLGNVEEKSVSSTQHRACPTQKQIDKDEKVPATERKQLLSSNFPVRDSGPSWSSASSLVVGGVTLCPEIADELGGYSPAAKASVEELDSGLVSVSSMKPAELSNDHVATPTSNNNQVTSSPSHPVSDVSGWLAMVTETIELSTLAEESVSDLLAEVDAMESQGGLSSPTSAINCVDDLFEDPDNDCFTPIGTLSSPLDSGKGDALSSTGDVLLPPQSSIADEPNGASQADPDSEKRSGGQSSSSPEGEVETKPVVMPFNWLKEAASSCRTPESSAVTQDIIDTDCTRRPWSTSLNIDWGTTQGNMNPGWEGSAQALMMDGWAGMARGNGNMNRSNPAAYMGRDSHPRYGGERVIDHRSSWSRHSSLGGGGGASSNNGGGNYSRTPPKGQRVCKFYESGRCKKGAFCDYLHP